MVENNTDNYNFYDAEMEGADGGAAPDSSPKMLKHSELQQVVSSDEMKAIVQGIQKVNEENTTSREATAGDLSFFLSDFRSENKKSAMALMDALAQAPITRAANSSMGYHPDDEFKQLNGNQDFSKAVRAVELMAWSGAINQTNDCAKRAKEVLKSLADKDYVQAQIAYAYLLAGDKKSDKAEIEKYAQMAEENKNTPDYLKNSTELNQVKEVLSGGDNYLWPHRINYPKTEETHVPPRDYSYEDPESEGADEGGSPDVSPTETQAESKEEKGQEEVKMQKEPIRDLNTLLAQHDLGELRSILGGIDTTDAHQLDLLNKIQQEYENRAQADYKPQDLNDLIQTAADVSFAHRIDNEMDDGVVDKVEVEVPAPEQASDTETRKQPQPQQGQQPHSRSEQTPENPGPGPQPTRGEEQPEELNDELPPLEEQRTFKTPGLEGFWTENKGVWSFDTSDMTSEERDLAEEILASHGIQPEKNGEDTTQWSVRGKEVKDLKRFWKYCARNTALYTTPLEIQKWTSPGLRDNWCRHQVKSFSLDNDVQSFSFNKPKAWYFNPNNLPEPDQKMARQYLIDHGVEFNETVAKEAMNSNKKGENPIEATQTVWVVRGDAMKKLEALWNRTDKNPELANAPKGMQPVGPAGLDKGGKPEEEKTQTPAPKGKGQPSQTPDKSAEGKGEKADKGGSALLDSLADAVKNFNDSTFGKGFSSPEAFGQEMLFQTLIFPLEWLDRYLKQVGVDKGEAGAKPAPQQAPQVQTPEQAQAIQAMLKKMVDKDMADGTGIFKELVDKGLIGSKSAHLDPAMRIENLRQALQDPANAELNKKLKNNFAAVAHENPDLFRAMYPADYKGPYTPDIMLNHLATWQSGKENTNVNTQEMIAELVKEVKKMQLELQAMKERMEKTETENAFLRQQLQDVKSGKIKPEDIRLTPDQAPEQQPQKEEGQDNSVPKQPQQGLDEQKPQPKTEQTNEPETKQPEVSSPEKSEETPVSPTETQAESKEEKGPEEVKTQKEPIRDLNTLLAQHDLGELRSILGGIDTTDAHQLDLLNKIQQEYENRAQADYKPQDLNDLIQTAADVSFAHRIDNEMDDGVVDKVEVEVPAPEKASDTETRKQPESEQTQPEVSPKEEQEQPETHEEQGQEPEQRPTPEEKQEPEHQPVPQEQPVVVEPPVPPEQPAQGQGMSVNQTSVQNTQVIVNVAVENKGKESLAQLEDKRTEAENKAKTIAQQKVTLMTEEEQLLKSYPKVFAQLDDKGAVKMNMTVGEDGKIYNYDNSKSDVAKPNSHRKLSGETNVSKLAEDLNDKRITAETLKRILMACSQKGNPYKKALKEYLNPEAAKKEADAKEYLDNFRKEMVAKGR